MPERITEVANKELDRYEKFHKALQKVLLSEIMWNG